MNSPLKQNITSLQNLLEQVNALPDAGGVDLPELINQAEASELFLNKELIDSNGNKVTGTFTIDSELSEQDDLIAQIASALKSKTCSGEQVEWSANEDAMVSGTLSSYFNNRVTSIGNHAFYNCHSLTTVSFPACTSIGRSAFCYCDNLTTASFPACTTIGISAFYSCGNLTTASFPACTTIGISAFYYCDNLTTASFPACTSIGSCAFCYCDNLTTVSFPACTTIGSLALGFCRNLTTVSFPACTTIGSLALRNCMNLKSLYLTGSRICRLENSNAFTSTPIGGYSASAGTYGSIYVPASLLTSYQTATNWTYFSSRFVGI